MEIGRAVVGRKEGGLELARSVVHDAIHDGHMWEGEVTWHHVVWNETGTKVFDSTTMLSLIQGTTIHTTLLSILSHILHCYYAPPRSESNWTYNPSRHQRQCTSRNLKRTS